MVVNMPSNMQLSLPSGSSVIIGQQLAITVTLTSDISISPKTDFYLSNNTAIIYIDSSNIKLGNGFGLFIVNLQVSPEVNDGDSITFDIGSSDYNFPTIPIQYTARTLDHNSLILKWDSHYIQVPHNKNIPPKGKFVRATAFVKDENQKSIPNLSVVISANSIFSLEKVNFYKSDNINKIDVLSFNNDNEMILNTDKKGRLILHVYPKESQALILSLYTEVYGVSGQIESEGGLQIIDKNTPDDNDKLAAPRIDGFNGGELNNEGQTTFLVKVEKYNDCRRGDVIHFSVNGKYNDYYYTVEDINNLGDYKIPLPYSIFPIDMTIEFAYTVSHNNSNILYSKSLELTYSGEPWPAPTYYDKCVVYSSFGHDDQNNIIQEFPTTECIGFNENNVVNCYNISNYYKNKHSEGLFVLITGTNDPDDKTKPPLGSKIYLKLNITANYRSPHKTYPGKIPETPGPDGKTAVGVISIPYNILNGCGQYEDCHAGLIQFDYQATSDNGTIQAKSWKGRISTANEGTPPEC